MRLIMKFLSYLVLIVTCSNLEGLDFEKKKISYNAKIDEKDYSASFKFKNNSKSSITLSNLKASCNCIIPQLKEKVYKPGESGEIELTYEFRNKIGLQQNLLKVFLEGRKDPINLVLEVNIPSPYKFPKRFEVWKAGDSSEKKLHLTLHKDFDAEVSLDIEANKSIPAKINISKIDKKNFQLNFTPSTPTKKGRYQAKIIFAQKDKPNRISYVYLIFQ